MVEYLAIAVFGFACWCVGVRMGSNYVAQRMIQELSK